jgi:hypothetical protein
MEKQSRLGSKQEVFSEIWLEHGVCLNYYEQNINTGEMSVFVMLVDWELVYLFDGNVCSLWINLL